MSSKKDNDEEKIGGFSATVSKIAQGILAVLVILSTVLTVYQDISPYYTVTIATILVVTLTVFLTLKNRYSTERYKAKLQQQLEIERNRQWHKSNEPLLDQSSKIGAVRNGKFAMCRAITDSLKESIKDPATTKEEKDVYEKVIKTIKDMEKVVLSS